MEQRISFAEVAPEGVRALGGLEAYVWNCGLEPGLLELVQARVTQLNGCDDSIDTHTKDARANGETEQRLHGLSAWRESPFYTDRERVALAWAVAVTLVSHGTDPDALHEETRRWFSEKELVDLTLAVVAINAGNRLNLAFRSVLGTYEPTTHVAAGVGSQDAGPT